MYQLVYASTAIKQFSDADLAELLKQARDFNKQHDITGMLLYKNQMFLQVLEGGESVVKALYASICNDQRHADVTLIEELHPHDREFSHWSMGFKRLDDTKLSEVEGLNNFLDVNFCTDYLLTNPSSAQLLLRAFRESA